MGIKSIRTYDKCEPCVGCPPFPNYTYGSYIYVNKRQKVNPLANGLNGSQFYNFQNHPNSNPIDLSNTTDFNHLFKLCKERGILFEGIAINYIFLVNQVNQTINADPQFPATNKALLGKRDSNPNKIWSSVVWMRPFQLVSRPKFINENNPNHRFDVELGIGSHLLAPNQPLFHATSVLYSMPKLFDRVINPLQTFNSAAYAGIWRFKFWKFGQWTEVVIGLFYHGISIKKSLIIIRLF